MKSIRLYVLSVISDDVCPAVRGVGGRWESWGAGDIGPRSTGGSTGDIWTDPDVNVTPWPGHTCRTVVTQPTNKYHQIYPSLTLRHRYPDNSLASPSSSYWYIGRRRKHIYFTWITQVVLIVYHKWPFSKQAAENFSGHDIVWTVGWIVLKFDVVLFYIFLMIWLTFERV